MAILTERNANTLMCAVVCHGLASATPTGPRHEAALDFCKLSIIRRVARSLGDSCSTSSKERTASRRNCVTVHESASALVPVQRRRLDRGSTHGTPWLAKASAVRDHKGQQARGSFPYLCGHWTREVADASRPSPRRKRYLTTSPMHHAAMGRTW